MKQPTVPEGFQDELYGFDIVTDDAPGLIAEVTSLLATFKMLIVGHSGERRAAHGPTHQAQAGQKYVVMMPPEFDHGAFNYQLTQTLKKYHGRMLTPLRPVPGLLWWW